MRGPRLEYRPFLRPRRVHQVTPATAGLSDCGRGTVPFVKDNRRATVRVFPAGYGPIHPHSDYRPFDVDQEFRKVWMSARHNTLVDEYRLFELWELVGQLDPVPGQLLEVGAWRGGSAAIIAHSACRLQENRRVYVADTFQGVVKASEKDAYYRGGEHADTGLAMVQTFLHNQRLQNVTLLPGVFPDDTGDRIAHERIAFCHIDVDVYESARDVFEWAWTRMNAGAVVVFDDYGFFGCNGLTEFVADLKSRTDCIVVANLNGHAVVVKR